MQVERERFYLHCERFGRFRELRVTSQQLQQLGALLSGNLNPLLGRKREIFPVPGVGVHQGLVAIRLTGLREKNERSGIGRLKAERQIEQNKGIQVEPRDTRDIQRYPHCHDRRLSDEKEWCAEKSSKGLRLEGEPVVPKKGNSNGGGADETAGGAIRPARRSWERPVEWMRRS